MNYLQLLLLLLLESIVLVIKDFPIFLYFLYPPTEIFNLKVCTCLRTLILLTSFIIRIYALIVTIIDIIKIFSLIIIGFIRLISRTSNLPCHFSISYILITSILLSLKNFRSHFNMILSVYYNVNLNILDLNYLIILFS